MFVYFSQIFFVKYRYYVNFIASICLKIMQFEGANNFSLLRFISKLVCKYFYW